ncbi:MAG: hypothetical protein KGR26_13000 [Cyanobacteria bacterium REEB65]|nr:hypothetical protein [Cyanobacteria bacterium REEB65]
MGRPRKDIAMESVRLHKAVLAKARKVVALRRDREPGLTIGDYLSNILMARVDRDFETERKRLTSGEE